MISEQILHEFATHIWYKKVTQSQYRSGVWNTKKEMDSLVQQLRKHIRNLENRYLQYEDQQRLRSMRQLLNNAEELSSKIALLAEALEYHRNYFNIYDTIDTTRNRYLQEITILESGRYSMEEEIKRYVLGASNSQYPLRNFVIDITADIEKMESKIRALGHRYPAKEQYAEGLVNCLVAIKNIVVRDPRYQQELYAYERARLQRLQVEAIKMQAQAELERAQMLRQQNRILEERNRLERSKLHQQQNIVEHIDITVTVQ
jgi:DNA repair ATPase RecN